MNESIDDSNSSKISGSNSCSSSQQDDAIGSGSQQGSSIGSAGSLVMRNHISSSGRKAVLVFLKLLLFNRIFKNLC